MIECPMEWVARGGEHGEEEEEEEEDESSP